MSNYPIYKKQYLNGQAVLTSPNEPVADLLHTIVSRATGNDSLKQHEVYAKALRYGLEKGLLRVAGRQGLRHKIYFTQKGYTAVRKLQKKTCLFSGRRMR